VLLSAEASVLLLVDLQPRFAPADSVIANAGRLAEAAALLDVPVRATVRGSVEPPLVWSPPPLARTVFNAVAAEGFAGLLPNGADEVVVAGACAHVGVLQTVLGLLAARHRVLVVADAVDGRPPAQRAVALDRMQHHGAELVTTEMVMYEWLRDAAHPCHAEVQRLLS
jgi:nicotinamidase-related amidase